MRAALLLKRECSMNVLISHWPWSHLSLRNLVPPVCESIEVLTQPGLLRNQMKNAASYTTCLAHSFIECLKKDSETKLEHLDMAGFPSCKC